MQIPYVKPSLPGFDELESDLRAIIESGRLTKGPIVEAYENALASRLGVRNVIATSSCTVGLALLYRALGFNAEVIVPSFTFMATVNALMWTSATPRFVDVDPQTWTIDPDRVEEAITPHTQAIVAVPVFGSPCDNDRLERIAEGAGVALIFDSAHGVGSSYRGMPLGRFGIAEAFSTTPTKTLVTGEGGFISTDDDGLATELRMLVEYGNDGSFDTHAPGLNGRLPEISALIGLRMLDQLDGLLQRRARIVEAYTAGLGDLPGITLQVVREGCVSSFKDFTVLIGDDVPADRDTVASRLAADGVQTKKYFVPAVHNQRPYRSLDVDLPVTTFLEHRALSLPLWSGMSDDEVDHVVASFGRALGS
jgi:dTDP-4-amino-4,6-dideoxygalactose transaminase